MLSVRLLNLLLLLLLPHLSFELGFLLRSPIGVLLHLPGDAWRGESGMLSIPPLLPQNVALLRQKPPQLRQQSHAADWIVAR